MLPREIKRTHQARGSASVRFFACRHMERTAHDDELDLVHAVPESLELVHAPARLQVRVVSSADGPHGRRLVPVRTRRSERASDIAKIFARGMPIGGTRCTCVTRTHAPRVGLRRVLKVRVGPAGAVHAHVARRRDVRTAVRLAHDGDDGDAGSGTHLPRAERARARASECKRVTTQRPGGLRTGFVSSSGARRARCDSGSAAMISISFGIFDVLSRRATCATRRGRDTSGGGTEAHTPSHIRAQLRHIHVLARVRGAHELQRDLVRGALRRLRLLRSAAEDLTRLRSVGHVRNEHVTSEQEFRTGVSRAGMTASLSGVVLAAIGDHDAAHELIAALASGSPNRGDVARAIMDGVLACAGTLGHAADARAPRMWRLLEAAVLALGAGHKCV